MSVQFHRLAEDEFFKVQRDYARVSIGVLRRFVTEVNAAVVRIDANPATGSPIFGQYRWVRVKGFKYLLFYRQLNPNLVMVYAVAHSSRRPGYWLRRVNRP
jgi:toxin ParE1/3/4